MAFNPYKHKFVARDQFGNVVWIEKYPRKELMEWVGIKHADKTYMDDEKSNSYHIGYRVGCHWFDVQRLSPLNVKPSSF